MGVIQSAVNSGMATLAAGIAAGKKIGTDTKKAKLEMAELKAEKNLELADIENKISNTKSDIEAKEALATAIEKNHINPDKSSYDPVDKKVIGEQDLWTDGEHVAYNVAKQRQASAVLQRNLEGLMTQRKALQDFLGIKEDKGGKK